MYASQLQGLRPGPFCICPRAQVLPQRSAWRSCSRPSTSLAAQAPTALPQSSELDEPIVNREASGPAGPDTSRDSREFSRPSYNNNRQGGGQSRFQGNNYQRQGGYQQREGGYQQREGGYQQRQGGYQQREGGFQRGPRPGAEDHQNRPPPVPVENFPHQIGDTIVGSVSWVGDRGCRVELEEDPSIRGFLPYSHSPYQLRNQEARPGSLKVPIGLRREFLITGLPDLVEHHGKGPLLNAKELDRSICWRRAQQLCELSAREKEWVELEIDSANRGGLVAFFEGTVVFIPFSRIPKAAGTIVTPEELATNWVGKKVDVVIEQVEPENNKIIGSIRTAVRYRHSRNMAVGNVLWATVQRMTNFGCFLRPEGGEVDGLLHISAISKTRVDDVEAVFQLGERVRVLVAGMEDDMRRISFSTALLEVNPGDMLMNKESVYSTAEEMAQAYAEGGMQQRMEPSGRPRRDNRNDNGSGYNNNNNNSRGGGRGDFDFDDFSSGNGSGRGSFDDVWEN